MYAIPWSSKKVFRKWEKLKNFYEFWWQQNASLPKWVTKKKCSRSLKRRKLFILIFTKMCQIYDTISGVKKSSAEIAEILCLFVRRCFDPSQQCGYLRFHLIPCIILYISFLLKEKKKKELSGFQGIPCYWHDELLWKSIILISASPVDMTRTYAFSL